MEEIRKISRQLFREIKKRLDEGAKPEDLAPEFNVSLRALLYRIRTQDHDPLKALRPRKEPVWFTPEEEKAMEARIAEGPPKPTLRSWTVDTLLRYVRRTFRKKLVLPTLREWAFKRSIFEHETDVEGRPIIRVKRGPRQPKTDAAEAPQEVAADYKPSLKRLESLIRKHRDSSRATAREARLAAKAAQPKRKRGRPRRSATFGTGAYDGGGNQAVIDQFKAETQPWYDEQMSKAVGQDVVDKVRENRELEEARKQAEERSKARQEKLDAALPAPKAGKHSTNATPAKKKRK
jgi:hypothetical protein